MHKYIAAVAISCCFMAGVSSAKTINIVADTSVASITEKPWLRDYLPDNTLFYARIPSIWNTFSYKQDSFKYALGNPRFTQSIKKLQQSSGSLLDSADKQLRPWLKLFIAQINGPIELAVLPGAALPELLISASIKFTSQSDLQQLITKLQGQRIITGVAAPLKDGRGLLKASIGNVPYRWNKEKDRLTLLVRLGGAAIADLDDQLASLIANNNSPMLANEQQLDSSGQGLYLWLNNTLAYPLYQGMLRSFNLSALQVLSLKEIKSIAISAGVRDHKGRVKLQIEAPTTGLIRSVLPTNANTLDITTAGEPSWSVLMAIPSREQFALIEESLNKYTANYAKYQLIKAKFSQTFGFEIAEIFAAIGAELVGVSDEVGEYGLIKIRDLQQFNTLLSALKKQPKVTFTSQSVAGVTINHLRFPGLSNLIGPTIGSEQPALVDKFLNTSSSHLYWQLEGEFLVLASLPQILIDRQLAKQQVNLGQWYKETQRQDISGSTLAISGSIEHAPRRIYYSYLEAMQFLADLSGTEIDTFSLPSAKQLTLAERGSLGFQLDSTEEAVALELSFESTPADLFLLAPAMATFSSFGLLSAIAIPAYQDYLFKVNLGPALLGSQGLKDQVAAAYLQNSQFPNQPLRDEILSSIMPRAGYHLDLVADLGEVITTFGKKRDKFIKWTPVISADSVTWQCTSNLQASLRPELCEPANW